MDYNDFKDRKAEILKMLPFYIALLHGRSAGETARLMDCEPVDIIQNVESYLFSIINVFDLVRGKAENIDIADYKRRREQFLRAAGLDEYADETKVQVKKMPAGMVDLNQFVSMN